MLNARCPLSGLHKSPGVCRGIFLWREKTFWLADCGRGRLLVVADGGQPSNGSADDFADNHRLALQMLTSRAADRISAWLKNAREARFSLHFGLVPSHFSSVFCPLFGRFPFSGALCAINRRSRRRCHAYHQSILLKTQTAGTRCGDGGVVTVFGLC